MGFFKRLSSLFSGTARQANQDVLWVAVRCNRCSEVIRTRINLAHDLSAEYGAEGGDERTGFICRKQVMGAATGERPCFQRIEIKLIFDERKRLAGKEISGGQFIEAEK